MRTCVEGEEWPFHRAFQALQTRLLSYMKKQAEV